LLSSKIWVRSGGIPEPERLDADKVVERFRKELNTDYLDLVQIHCMEDGNWTDTQKRQMDIMDNLKSRGIIKAHGVSVHSLEAMSAALRSPWVDVIHVRINPYGIAMDKPDPMDVVEVINQLHTAGKGVIGMKLIGNGKLSNDKDKIEAALKFVLGLGSVNMMIIGFDQIDQIDNYLGLVERKLGEM
jgi:aryl-alcohol dehydrogenase-like predicted oxidoreductase